MRGLEWVFSGVLAIVFLVVGITKALRYGLARKAFAWVSDLPEPLVRFIGLVEILGALGLVLPVATGMYAWLTPVAAIALGLLVLMAASFHAVRRESDQVFLNVLLLILLGVVAYSRWSLLP